MVFDVVNAVILPPPPLWGRAGEGGGEANTGFSVCLSPPSLTLPYKGGGNSKKVLTA